jgi:tetratricopeptide (TPR) repeat protein
MGNEPKAENTELSMEELITGIGKLVYKLNESVVNIDGRIEKLETGISSLLQEKFDGVTAELVKSNELLADMRMAHDAPEKTTRNDIEPAEKAATPSGALIDKLDELKTEVSGVREDIGRVEDKLLKALSEGPDGFLTNEILTKEFSELSVMITESASAIQKTVTEAVTTSDDKRGTTLSENLKVLTEGIGEISSKMDGAKESIQEKLSEIQSSTAEEVGSISSGVKENSEAQNIKLDEMKELLTLHSAEVQDNRVQSLNRSAIVHYNNAEHDLAVSDLKEALDLNPDSPELLANLAHIEASQGKLKEAEKHFKKALEISPDMEPAVSGLGTVLVMTDRAGDTIDFLQKYLEDGSNASVGIMIALSRAYISQGDHAKALAILEKAEKNAPGHPELEQELAQYRS